MALVLIKEIRRGGESKISFCYIRGLRASPQTYRGWRNLVRVEYLLIVKANGGWFLVYWGLILLWVMSVEFEYTCTISGKQNEDPGSVQGFIFWFCVWCKSRKLGGRVSLRFPCVIPVMESFSSDLLQAMISYGTKSHLESCQTFTMKLFSKNSQRPKEVDYIRKQLHRRCLTGFQMRFWLERCCKCGV